MSPFLFFSLSQISTRKTTRRQRLHNSSEMSICRLHDIYYHIKISSILQENFCFFMPNARRKSFEIYNL
ncbi:hypothetical protein C6A32_08595 [Streptococcus anginosus]|nr:hypothetical protein C6A32_08595 [Streptococcus anginosus]QOG24115.1 hypothetical protein FPL13_00265 [Streptococcus sp. KS 6]